MSEPRVPGPTARLVFRPWDEADLPLARELFGEPRVTALVGGPFDEAAIAARLAFELDNQREHGIAYWPVALAGARGAPGASGQVIGCCGLKPRELARRVHELGFYFLPAYWGQGFAPEAGASVVAFAFDVLGCAGLFAGHHPENHGSRRALEKLGFCYAHHELYPPTGLQHPCYELPRPV